MSLREKLKVLNSYTFFYTGNESERVFREVVISNHYYLFCSAAITQITLIVKNIGFTQAKANLCFLFFIFLKFGNHSLG